MISSAKKIKRETIYKYDVSFDSVYTEQSDEYGVLLMGPHPLMGGTMHNSVLKCIESTFLELGFSSLRFNFRGVGISQGSIADRSNDIYDALWITDYLTQLMPKVKEIWVGGFGYGAYVAINIAMRRPCIKGFVAVTPHYIVEEGLMNLLTPCPDGAIFNGTADNVVPCINTRTLSKALHSQEGTKIYFYPVFGAGHNYSGHDEDLKIKISNYLSSFMMQNQVAKEQKIERYVLQ